MISMSSPTKWGSMWISLKRDVHLYNFACINGTEIQLFNFFVKLSLLIGPRACWNWLFSEMAAIRPTLIHKNPFLASSFSVGTNSLSMKEEIDENHLEVPSNRNHELEVSRNSLGLAQERSSRMGVKNVAQVKDADKVFDEMKMRFLSFKKHKYLKNLEHFQALAELQAPKFMVISCVDSRVCPSNILGFQPGEAFTVRNVANIVPSWENGPTETNAALEFAVNTLKVENILVIGHSSCAGIQSLMSMEDDATDSSFVHKWMVNAKVAKLRAKAAAAHLNFDQQCKHCEKESINLSLKNLMTYPWIEERLKQESLAVHGGYYDFLSCTFEKWTLDYKNTCKAAGDDDHGFQIKNQSVWC
ncbi:beta carbonic anhydrase 5, chloroplastic-like isoform X2 [Cucurbita pepo subsp. pepo]|uniref:beta carbonic anhydrase 5, chloroplastic-like isoform X2 n=1 Tax=Cucurbita pepo subsp. pepo TaxID=3664 RepID=UPI000C9D4BCF|nr:beta carbonic anhydrase 5, chloroplastic-like isoform X2 [Cucurbita pepo subsp. pepo]